ncbi:MAG: methyltransferase domain-containing protein [Marinilabiliales bacterium]|nr:methyltransferase domain-containing protein [Marinilabiliales bacterium]
MEKMPLPDNRFDVVLSNCVLNLVPDKNKAFSEIMRVLKPGGHFCVSDIVLRGELTDEMRADAELYAGCVAGAMQFDDYADVIRRNGFKNILVHKEKQIQLPVTLKPDSVENNEAGIFSITITAHKPQSANNLHINNS